MVAPLVMKCKPGDTGASDMVRNPHRWMWVVMDHCRLIHCCRNINSWASLSELASFVLENKWVILWCRVLFEQLIVARLVTKWNPKICSMCTKSQHMEPVIRKFCPVHTTTYSNLFINFNSTHRLFSLSQCFVSWLNYASLPSVSMIASSPRSCHAS